MAYHGSPLPEDQYDGRDEACDPRIYHSADWCENPNDFDDTLYRLTSRRFPEGQLVKRYYSLTDCACQVVSLWPEVGMFLTAYATPAELTPA